mgnify:CR=1 FL=1
MATSIATLVKPIVTPSGSLLSPVSMLQTASLTNKYFGIAGTGIPYGSAGGYKDRYGSLDSSGSSTEAYLQLQATSYTKKVKVTAVLGSQVAEQSELFLRVYREISYFHLSSSSKLVRAPKVTTIGDYTFSGSYGYRSPALWKGIGSQQIWWIVWTGDNGQMGMLIDNCASPMSASSVDSNPDFWSGSKLTNGIQTFHQGSAAWNSTYGLKIYQDNTNITYYIDDIDAGVAPATGSDVLSQPPTIVQKKLVADSKYSLRWVDSRTQYAPGTIANIVPGRGDLTWSNIDYITAGQFSPIAVDGNDYFTIQRLFKISQPPAQPASLGGKALVHSGAKQNWIKGNIDFETDMAKASSSKWAPYSKDETGENVDYLKLEIIDGQDIQDLQAYAPGSGYGSIDNKWLSGASNDPTKYWYILPKVARGSAGSNPPCCTTSGVHASLGEVRGAFVNASNCMQGRHWGKFLKSGAVVGVTGFTSGDLAGWVSWLTAIGKTMANMVASQAQFTGVRQHTQSETQTFNTRLDMATLPPAASARLKSGSSPISFYLREIEQFSAYKTLVTVSGGGSPSTTGDSLPPATDGIEQSILDKLTGPFTATKIYEWTQTTLAQFVNEQSNTLGVPLSSMKMEMLQLFYDAKVAWYKHTYRVTTEIAMAQVAKDPVYRSLVALFVSAAPAASGGGSGGSGGSGGGGGGGGGGGTSPGSSTTTTGNQGGNNTKTIRITVTRGLPGYRAGVRSVLSSTRPTLVQTYDTLEKPRIFEFPFVPNQVNYSGLGAQWTEIERTGTFPVVDWQSFQLLKVSFSFDLVAKKNVEAKPGFGLYFSCEDDIRTLRLMAQSPYPVTFLNMDQFMSEEVRYPLFTRGRGIEFVIAEFSVTSVQRTPETLGTNTSETIVPNQISRATCQMTLQEIPIEAVDIVQMPPIKPCKKKCEDKPDITKENLRTYLLFEDGFFRA